MSNKRLCLLFGMTACLMLADFLFAIRLFIEDDSGRIELMSVTLTATLLTMLNTYRLYKYPVVASKSPLYCRLQYLLLLSSHLFLTGVLVQMCMIVYSETFSESLNQFLVTMWYALLCQYVFVFRAEAIAECKI